MKRIFLFSVLAICTLSSFAQNKSDIFKRSVTITWLGLDFTQMKFVGDASQFQGIGNVTSSEIRDVYIPAWNDLFIDERKKYSLAEATNRIDVKFAVDITAIGNSAIESDFFVTDTTLYQLLNEQKIIDIIKKYNFKGREGLGMLFFVEGMHKEKKEMSVLVTFVNMTNKEVLLVKRLTGNTSRVTGFRNFWARALYDILLKMKDDWDLWKE